MSEARSPHDVRSPGLVPIGHLGGYLMTTWQQQTLLPAEAVQIRININMDLAKQRYNIGARVINIDDDQVLELDAGPITDIAHADDLYEAVCARVKVLIEDHVAPF